MQKHMKLLHQPKKWLLIFDRARTLVVLFKVEACNVQKMKEDWGVGPMQFLWAPSSIVPNCAAWRKNSQTQHLCWLAVTKLWNSPAAALICFRRINPISPQNMTICWAWGWFTDSHEKLKKFPCRFHCTVCLSFLWLLTKGQTPASVSSFKTLFVWFASVNECI